MLSHADVIIAGAGPAGSAAAHVLAAKGYSVLVVDKAAFPRPKLCGGLLTWKTVRLLERLHAIPVRTLIDTRVVDTVSDRFSLFHRERLITQGRSAYPFHLVNRTAFDTLLLDRAREAGAVVVEDCTVQQCDPDGRLWTTQGEVRGRYVVGADGVNSTVRRSFGLSRKKWSRNLAAAIEISVPRNISPRIAEHPELYAGIIPAGYGWVFPNTDRMILGICGLPGSSPNFRSAFKEFLHVLGESNPDRFLRAHPLRGHPLPYGNALANPVKENALLVGDAGGYADPLLGEGIFYALLTGWHAGEAVAEALRSGKHPGRAYQQRIHDVILPEMRGANRLRWFLYGLNAMSPRNMGRYFRLRTGILGEMVHGLRSYNWARKKNWGF